MLGEMNGTCIAVHTCAFSAVSCLALSVLEPQELSRGRRKMSLMFPTCLPSILKFPLPICPIQLHLCVMPA